MPFGQEGPDEPFNFNPNSVGLQDVTECCGGVDCARRLYQTFKYCS